MVGRVLGHCEAKGRDSKGQGVLGSFGRMEAWWALRGGLTRVRGAAVGKGDGIARQRGASGGQGCPMPSPSRRAHPAEPSHGDSFFLLGEHPRAGMLPAGESCSPAQGVKDFLEASLHLHTSDCCTAPLPILPPQPRLPVPALLPALAPPLPTTPSLPPDLPGPRPSFCTCLPTAPCRG